MGNTKVFSFREDFPKGGDLQNKNFRKRVNLQTTADWPELCILLYRHFQSKKLPSWSRLYIPQTSVPRILKMGTSKPRNQSRIHSSGGMYMLEWSYWFLSIHIMELLSKRAHLGITQIQLIFEQTSCSTWNCLLISLIRTSLNQVNHHSEEDCFLELLAHSFLSEKR